MMPNTLTDDLLSTLKQRLNANLSALTHEVHDALLRADDEKYIELAGQVHDLEDESIADLLVDVNLAEIDRHIQEIRDTEASLLRMAEGVYGSCVACQGEIGLERLQAYPTAKRCLACQGMHEKTFYHPTQAKL